MNIVPGEVETELRTSEMLGVVPKRKSVSLEIIRLLAELELASFVESEKTQEGPDEKENDVSQDTLTRVFKSLPMFHF